MVIVRPLHQYLLSLCDRIGVLAKQLSDLDLQRFTFLESDAELGPNVAAPLQNLLGELLRDLTELEEAATEDGWHDVGNVCFIGLVQLRAAQRELTAPKGHVELLVGCERTVRHVSRLAHALGDAADVASGKSRRPGSEFSKEEIDTALAVRRLFNAFRNELRPAASETREDVLHALRYGASALARIVGSHEFALVRAADRALLLTLQSRVIAWARSKESVQEGLQLLQDLCTTAELLRSVNQRQELRAHDEELASRVGAALAKDADVAPHADELARLEGHDAELDGWLTALRRGQLDKSQAGDLVATLQRIGGTEMKALA